MEIDPTYTPETDFKEKLLSVQTEVVNKHLTSDVVLAVWDDKKIEDAQNMLHNAFSFSELLRKLAKTSVWRFKNNKWYKTEMEEKKQKYITKGSEHMFSMYARSVQVLAPFLRNRKNWIIGTLQEKPEEKEETIDNRTLMEKIKDRLKPEEQPRVI